MLNAGFILLPLYIYPNPSAWNPLLTAAKAYPNVNFAAVVNPANGPGLASCPGTDYINAVNNLYVHDNIKTIGYVHTANSYNCGSSGTDICTCSVPLEEMQANVTTYQSWSEESCGLQVDGIFIDEAPSEDDCVEYMRSATSFVKNTPTGDSTVIFNAGTSVDTAYWDIADYINVLENTESAYKDADIGEIDGDERYTEQSTFIIYDYASGRRQLRKDVNTLLGSQGGSLAAVAGLYISDFDVYDAFPGNWRAFVSAVDSVIQARKGR